MLWALLDRPEVRNAIDSNVLANLEGLVTIARAEQVNVVVIRGAGGTFCSGADLRELRRLADDPPALETFMGRLGAILEDLERAPWVTIAVVEGHAVAGGLELLLAADLVVASTDARMGDAHVNLGLVPAAGSSVRLPRAVAPAFARYLLLTGETLSGAEAADMGLIAAAVEPGALDDEVARIVDRVSSRRRATLRTVKAMLAEKAPGPSRLRHELELFLDHVASAPDARDGIGAFLSQREVL